MTVSRRDDGGRSVVRDEGGQSVVLIAISLPLILTLLLLVIDGGRLYVERERIRDAAQLAAEAAVSLAADEPEARAPKDADVRAMVADALSRNLGGEAYSYDVAIPYRKDISVFNVKVSVTKPFRSSIAAIGFTIGADGAAKLGGAGSFGSGAQASAPVPSSPSPTPSPTAAPSKRCYEVWVTYEAANALGTLLDGAPAPLYATIGSVHSWTTTFRGWGTSTFSYSGTFAVPNTSTRMGALSITSNLGAFAKCP